MICRFCFKLAAVSLLILIVLLTTLSYVGVPLVVICGWVSFSDFCKKKLKDEL